MRTRPAVTPSSGAKTISGSWLSVGRLAASGLDTISIRLRASIPKEFILLPMGHQDEFVRTVGNSVSVQSWADVKLESYDFFKDAKFSLWWLPEVNNVCRLHLTFTAGAGQDGGMNFT